MKDGKDWSKVVVIDELFDYVLAKYGKGWKNDDAIVNIIVDNLWKKSTINQRLQKLYNAEVIVKSSNDDALSTDEQITLMADIPFSTTDDDSD
nr:hypothetical protein [Tanacetum cinerariifolium]